VASVNKIIVCENITTASAIALLRFLLQHLLRRERDYCFCQHQARVCIPPAKVRSEACKNPELRIAIWLLALSLSLSDMVRYEPHTISCV